MKRSGCLDPRTSDSLLVRVWRLSTLSLSLSLPLLELEAEQGQSPAQLRVLGISSPHCVGSALESSSARPGSGSRNKGAVAAAGETLAKF